MTSVLVGAERNSRSATGLSLAGIRNDVMSSFERSPSKEGLLEKAWIFVETEKEAAALVEEFWRAMPHGKEVVRSVELDEEPDWRQTLTEGDRTIVRRANGLEKKEGKGDWVVLFRGNNNPLSHEATEWLRAKRIV